METLIRDLRLSLRSLRRRPGFVATVVATLALGIGVNVSMFQVVYGLVVKPLPFIESSAEAGHLVALAMSHDTARVEAFDFSPPDVADFADQCTVCATVAGFDRRDVVMATRGGTLEDGARRVAAQAVSPELFDLLGADALRGRTLAVGEDAEGAPRVAVLSHRLWRQLGGGDGEASDEAAVDVGSDLLLDGRATRVVGVMPPGFHFPERADLWIPLEKRPDDLRSRRWVDNVIVRLLPGVDLERVRAEAVTISKRLAVAYPESNLGWSFAVMPFRERLVSGEERRTVALLSGAVFFVFLIACVNVTNLLLARESDRRQASAIRIALGSDRLGLVRLRMTENLLLALAGGVLGVLVSAWVLDYLARADPRGWPAWLEFDLGVATFVFMVALSVLAVLAFGLLPAMRASKPDLGRAIGQSQTVVGAKQPLQQSLVIGQIALALTLLVGASLMLKSLSSLFRVDAGFDTTNMLTLRAHLPEERYEDPDERRVLFTRLVEGLESMPGVKRAAATSAIPLLEDGTAVPISYPSQVLRDGERQVVTYILQTPGLFDVLGVPLVAGRGFTSAEAADPESRVVIVNEELALNVWGRRDPVGERLRLGYEQDAPWSTVIGVVPKIYYEEPGEESDQSRFQVHLPYARIPWRVMGVLVRTEVDPATLAADVRRQLARVDPAIAVDAVHTMETVRSRSLWGERLISKLFASFAALALVLSALGIYGVMAYAVAQRRREIGVRMALGADRRDVRGLFVARGLFMVVPGMVLGWLGASAAGQLLRNLLFGVEAGDPVAFAAAFCSLLVAAAFGVLIPAGRATRIDPAVTLRQE